jgi:hypothetical protein
MTGYFIARRRLVREDGTHECIKHPTVSLIDQQFIVPLAAVGQALHAGRVLGRVAGQAPIRADVRQTIALERINLPLCPRNSRMVTVGSWFAEADCGAAVGDSPRFSRII